MRISWKKLFAAGLTAAAVMNMSGMSTYAALQDAVVGQEGTATVVQAGQAQLSSKTGPGVQGQTVGNQSQAGGVQAQPGGNQEQVTAVEAQPVGNQAQSGGTQGQVTAVQAPNQSSGGVQASPNASMAATPDKKNVVIAGGGKAGVGGVYTEGEKGYPNQEAILGGAELIMFNSQNNSQMVSCMLRTNNGSLIVIDGGLGTDADYLKSQIKARGGQVAAWLITHPHGDHVGALYKIMQDEDARYASGQPAEILIDGVYYNFASPEWYSSNDPDESTMELAMLGMLSGRPESMLHTVHKGEKYTVDNAVIEVMNDRYETASDKGNNACIVYKITINGKTLLFLGDMSSEGGNRLLAEAGAGALKADIVQMAHHGQNGVSREFYQAVSPSICLWPTPAWLWTSMESKYMIQNTKNWMSDLGVQRHYCMKDGDQIIR